MIEPGSAERGCDFCADDDMYFGHVEQVGSDEASRLLLLRCPRCGWLYEASARGDLDARRVSLDRARARGFAPTRLGFGDGPRISLDIVGYQFPDKPGAGDGRDWDANWLVVAGEARSGDGRTWSFRDPCLTTWEARRLGRWLQDVIDGSVLPSELDGGPEERLLVFTEPNLAFSLEDRSADRLVLRVHLSLESRPPWLGPGDPDIFDYYLSVRLSVDELALAVASWQQRLVTFPER